jgi:NADPH:quinone reductase-like Zn-dependent oxidoreductase
LTTFRSKEHHSHIERLADLIASGSAVPAIGNRYRLDEVPTAMADLEEGRERGKSVVIVRETEETDAR